MWKVKLPNTPALCDICLNASSNQIVPDRESGSNPIDWRFQVFCPLCFDQFIDFFPIKVKKILGREIHGKFIR